MEQKRLRCSQHEAVSTLKALWYLDARGVIRLTNEVMGNNHLVESRTTKPLSSFLPEIGFGDNPLWDIVRWFPTGETGCCGTLPKVDGYCMSLASETLSKLYGLGLERMALCKTYAFSIISPSDTHWIGKMAGPRGVVEINAGRGYWAWQLEQIGVNVAAYDPHPPAEGNVYFETPGTFARVMRRDHTAVELHPDRALLTVWPDYGDGYAAEALKRYTGDMVIYSGEGYGGCTADDEFFEILENDWEWISSAPSHVSWYGVHCRLEAYVRKTKALTK